MLYPRSVIKWMDLKEERVIEGTIDDLFKMYARHINVLGKDVSVIAFSGKNDPKINMQDWTGWTAVQAIWKLDNLESDETWYKMSVEDHPEINLIVSNHELIPAYIPEKHKVGFHGEIKYAYHLRNPAKFLSNNMMRVRGIEDLFPDHPQFAKVIFEDITVLEKHGYCIYTVSGFLNMNGFHMYSKDMCDINVISGSVEGWK